MLECKQSQIQQLFPNLRANKSGCSVSICSKIKLTWDIMCIYIVAKFSWIDWMVFYTAFNSISVISRRQLTLFMSSWVSPVLGWGSEVSCPRTLPRKNPEDPVQLEPRTPGLQVKHFTTEPCRSPPSLVLIGQYLQMLVCTQSQIWQIFEFKGS